MLKTGNKKEAELARPKPHEGLRIFWRRFGAVVAVLAAGTLAHLVGGVLAGQLLKGISPLLPILGNTEQQFISYLVSQACIILLLLCFVQLFKVKWQALGLGKIKNWTLILLVPLLYIICVIVSHLLVQGVSEVFPLFDPRQMQDVGLKPTSQYELVMSGVFLALVVPFVEEFIFRGYLFGLLRRQLPFWLTTLLVSVIFAALHGQWNVAIDVFVLSIVLCFLREKTGSIWAGVLLHALKNFVAFLLIYVYTIM